MAYSIRAEKVHGFDWMAVQASTVSYTVTHGIRVIKMSLHNLESYIQLSKPIMGKNGAKRQGHLHKQIFPKLHREKNEMMVSSTIYAIK